jgi:hypothetical protein
VQGGASEPVSAQADGIEALEAGDPPRGTGGDLFGILGVFVDVDLALWEAVGLEESGKRAIGVLDIVIRGTSRTLEVVRVLVWDCIVLGNLRKPISPPSVVVGRAIG